MSRYVGIGVTVDELREVARPLLLSLHRIESRLDLVLHSLQTLIRQENAMATQYMDLTDLVAEVAATATVEASAVTAIEGLVAKIAALPVGGDPNILSAALADLKASAAPLAAAIAAIPPDAPATPAPEAPAQ